MPWSMSSHEYGVYCDTVNNLAVEPPKWVLGGAPAERFICLGGGVSTTVLLQGTE